MLKRFASYYKPHRKLFYIDMFCALIISACNMFYPIIAKDIINVYVPGQNMGQLVLWCCVLLGIYLLKAGMTFVVTTGAISWACAYRRICAARCSTILKSCP